MQLVIDIPDKVYEMVMNTGTYGCYRFISTKAIREGTPLDKIRAEIDELSRHYNNDYFSSNKDSMFKCKEVFEIIDKHLSESEDKE